jgi:hypothetical protein
MVTVLRFAGIWPDLPDWICWSWAALCFGLWFAIGSIPN